MLVIVVTNRKGGAGKSTVSGQLAVAAELAGWGPVALIDTDEQGSLAQWWNAREADTPLFTQCEVKDLKEHLEALEQEGIKLVIIDTPPGINTESSMVLEQIIPCADLALIPTRPSPHDLRAVGATVELVEDAGKRMIFVINGAANRAKITGEAAIVLSQHGTVAPVTLYQRTDFASSMTDGRTVLELDPEGKSAQEITALWKYVSTQLLKQ